MWSRDPLGIRPVQLWILIGSVISFVIDILNVKNNLLGWVI